jgi:hypothetical protein
MADALKSARDVEMTYRLLLLSLTQAESRLRGNWPSEVKEQSADTIERIELRLKREGLTREQLEELAKAQVA